MGADADKTPRGGRTHPPGTSNSNSSTTTVVFNNSNESRDSIDDPSRSSIDESSRSSSKASSINEAATKPPKPRRPTNYAERKSSINKRPTSISAPIRTLTLNQTVLGSPMMASRQTVPSPPVSAKNTPKSAAFTPTLEQSQPLRHIRQIGSVLRTEKTDSPIEDSETQYFTLPPPTRPEKEIPKSPATQMYWHQPPMHGMMKTGPARRSHSVAQIGPTIYIFGGSDGKPPKATNSVFIFDTGT